MCFQLQALCYVLYSNTTVLLPQKQRLNGKEVIFITRKRQYIWQGLFGFFYIKQYPNLAFHQISSHVTIKLSKKAVVRHIIKRAIMGYIQQHESIKTAINGKFYKFFIVLSKDRVAQLEQKIANLPKKDIITYIQQEFEKSRKWVTNRLDSKRA